jgi:hypothetical protein
MNSDASANRTNPFSHWIEEDPERGPVACEIYDTTLAALKSIPADHPDPVAAAEPVLHAMITQLDDLDDSGFMDTIRREEAGDAFAELAEMAGVPSDISDAWFDEWREF